jgi:cytochrome c oxidase cbb3-type subunit 1
VFGLVLMFLSLTAAGVIQGYLWKSLALWEDSIIASFPYWMIRTYAGIAIIAAQFLLFYNMWMTSRRAPERARASAAVTAGAAGV